MITLVIKKKSISSRGSPAIIKPVDWPRSIVHVPLRMASMSTSHKYIVVGKIAATSARPFANKISAPNATWIRTGISPHTRINAAYVPGRHPESKIISQITQINAKMAVPSLRIAEACFILACFRGKIRLMANAHNPVVRVCNTKNRYSSSGTHPSITPLTNSGG